MANERLFLAYLRSSLSFITIGIGVTQLLRLENAHSSYLHALAKPLGLSFIVLGIATLLFGTNRYFLVQNMMVNNQFPATRLGIIVLIVSVVLLILITMVVVLVSV